MRIYIATRLASMNTPLEVSLAAMQFEQLDGVMMMTAIYTGYVRINGLIFGDIEVM